MNMVGTVAAIGLITSAAPPPLALHGSLVTAISGHDHVVMAADSATTTSRMQRGPEDRCKLVVGRGYAIGITGLTESAARDLYDIPRALRAAVVASTSAESAVLRLLREQDEAFRVMAVASQRKADALYGSMLKQGGDDGRAPDARLLLLSLLAADMQGSGPRIRATEVIVALPRSGILALQGARVVPRTTDCIGGRCGPFVAIGHSSVLRRAYWEASNATRLASGWQLAHSLLEAQAAATPFAVGPPFSAVRVDAAGVTWIHRHPPC